ncbi:MAG: porin [Acidobacteria bacterium]|nr:porin [Acidobacteriota bacterium]
MRTLLVSIALFVSTLSAQTPPPAKPSFTLGSFEFSGVADGYFSHNSNKPDSAFNAVRNFDTQAGRPALNMARLAISNTAGPVGFRVDIGGGRAFNTIHFAEPNLGNGVMRHVAQAYVSFKPASWNGVQLDFGKFYTSAGAEVTETHLNWNYSRSLLFALGPYYHFGARITAPVKKNWTVGAQLVNGWNNVDDLNSGKTVGVTSSLTLGRIVINNAFYSGPEKVGAQTKGWRNFADTVVSAKVNDQVALLFNYDYGTEANINGGRGQFQGFAAAARYQFNKKIAFSPRLEFYQDRDGVTSGVAQNLKEVTLTGEYKFTDWMLGRVEFRRDASNQPYFDRGNGIANAKQQTTVLAGLVVYFEPKK